VIDIGALSIVAFSGCLISDNKLGFIEDHGKEAYLHTVITGGQAAMDTARGFPFLINQIPREVKLVMWKDEYFGPLVVETDRGEMLFKESIAYTENQSRIFGEVVLRAAGSGGDFFKQDMIAMLKAHMTFADVKASDDFGMMAKRRMAIVNEEFSIS
jgi:hypothetical protein